MCECVSVLVSECVSVSVCVCWCVFIVMQGYDVEKNKQNKL